MLYIPPPPTRPCPEQVVSRRPADGDPERFAEPPVSPRVIREAVLRQLGIRLHSSHLMLDGNIAGYGSFKVPMNLRLSDDRQVELTVHVDRRGKPGSAAAGGAAAGSRAP
ncbi:hypothetical protein GPECTOR_6g505 [Gonium pectorale]|uniref:Ribosomal protein L9 C-terminal domain-containing protein n=1 Tax=Gonium pectorale TaxID=33097 RepID=A0A150GV71_GONPE|nr:hypothetical protein GPECTOR_6g505 [Gonium pectorale]|eukprot:KXZ53588.1 hypothetical protein GPECTOR_6g505 [Gonium pectorale]